MSSPTTEAKRAAVRAYMRDYMRAYRERQRSPELTRVEHLRQSDPAAYSTAQSVASIRRRARPGFCDTCGISYPTDSRCPLCRDSDARLPVDLRSWEAVVMVAVN